MKMHSQIQIATLWDLFFSSGRHKNRDSSFNWNTYKLVFPTLPVMSAGNGNLEIAKLRQLHHHAGSSLAALSSLFWCAYLNLLFFLITALVLCVLLHDQIAQMMMVRAVAGDMRTFPQSWDFLSSTYYSVFPFVIITEWLFPYKQERHSPAGIESASKGL